MFRNGGIRKRARALAHGRRALRTASRLGVIVAVTAIASGSIVAATPALASTPAPLAITASSPLAANAGSSFSARLGATGGTKPYTWSLAAGSALPAGLVLHASTGEVSGEPLGPGGTFNFTAEVTDSESTPVSVTAPESITVTVTPLAVNTVSLPAATASAPYSATLRATGGVAPYSWSLPVGSLPAGLKLKADTGVISGTPTAGGTFTLVAEVTDSEGSAQSASAQESITVSIAGLVVSTGSTLPTATSGLPYSLKLGAEGGVTPYQWSLASGSLPAGLKLKSTGVISGTTTATGQDNFTLQVTDSEAPAVSATENVSLYVVNALVVPSDLPGATAGQSYDTSLQPAGGLGPYSYSITAGSLPPELSLQSDGEITGTASGADIYSFTVSVTDSENPPVTVTQAESITVSLVPTTCSAAAENTGLFGSADVLGSAFQFSFILGGTNSPTGTVTYSLINGQDTTVSTDSYQISGQVAVAFPAYAPTAAGTYELVVAYSGDAINAACQATSSLTVTSATPAISAIASNDAAGAYDTAFLQGGYNTSGTVTFNLYGPFAGAPTCSSPMFSVTVSMTGSGDASSYGPTNPTLTSPGTYYWTASYSGDANNAAVSTGCGDPNEEVTVAGS